MVTVRQIERDWDDRKYEKLLSNLVAARPEQAFQFDIAGGRAVPAAAVALVRLDELNQTHVPLYARLVRALLAAQSYNDGGWGDPAVTALCLRALLGIRGNGNGVSVERGMDYLADLQKDDGLWPAGPIRRMAADACTSAFILYQLADSPAFRDAVRFQDAVNWFELRADRTDADTRRWWRLARMKCTYPMPLSLGEPVGLS